MDLLKSKTAILVLPLVFFFGGPAQHASAESAVTCHCFKNRSYNPADRFAADDYILASGFNSLLSKFFALPKRQIVMIKMNQGVSQDDLLVGLKIAKATGTYIDNILKLRREDNAWSKIISGLPQQEKIKNVPLLEAIKSGLSVDEAGEMIADEMLAAFYRIPIEEIKKSRISGLNEKEINLLYILAHAGKQKPEVLVSQYRKQGKGWSEIAYNSGLKPAEVGKLILAYPAREITE